MDSAIFTRFCVILIVFFSMLLSCNSDKKTSNIVPIQKTDSLQYLIKKSDTFYDEEAYDSAYFYDKKLYEYAQLIKNDSSQGRAAFNLGDYFGEIKKNPDSAFYYYNVAANSYKQAEDSTNVASNLLNCAIIQKDRNDHFGAKETLTEALKYLKNKEDTRTEASIYDQLGTNNQRLENFEDAIKYHKKAIETTNSPNDVIGYNNNLALALIENQDFKQSLKILNELIKDSLSTRKLTRYARILHNLEYARWKYNKEENIENFYKALKIRKEQEDSRGLLSSHTNLAEYYLETQPEVAKRHIDTLIKLSKKTKSPQAERDALILLMSLDTLNTKIRDRYILLTDSLNKISLKVKTQFAKLKYDGRLNRERIEKLELETVKNNAQIKEQKLQKAIFISISIFILAFSIAMYFFIRERNRKEQIQTIYSTERRLSKKIHDELANEVYGVMNTVQYNKEDKKEKLLDKLELIYNKTRDISRTYNQDVLEVNFAQQLKDVLTEYHSNNTSIIVKGLHENLFTTFPKHKKETLLLVLQEIMVNMIKHSKASLVVLTFAKVSKEILVTYKDNGVGVNLLKKDRNGLYNMETRIKDIKGKFTFVSQQGNGVKITISIPL